MVIGAKIERAGSQFECIFPIDNAKEYVYDTIYGDSINITCTDRTGKKKKNLRVIMIFLSDFPDYDSYVSSDEKRLKLIEKQFLNAASTAIPSLENEAGITILHMGHDRLTIDYNPTTNQIDHYLYDNCLGEGNESYGEDPFYCIKFKFTGLWDVEETNCIVRMAKIRYKT